MRIFPKIFISILCFVILIIFSLSFILAQYQIAYTEQDVKGQNMILGDFLSKEIEIGYQSEWPYESLSKLAEREDFMFWWVVKEDGSIYRADNVSFIGTNAFDYFPEMEVQKESVYTNKAENYAIYSKTISIGENKLQFWLGFSLGAVSKTVNTMILTVLAVSSIAIIILGIFLFFAIRSFTNPVKKMLEGAREISKGNFDVRTDIKTKDEIGNLSSEFNNMAKSLKESKVKLEEYNKSLEEEVKNRTKELEEKNTELERFNKLAVGRELKMIELKKKLKEKESKQ